MRRFRGLLLSLALLLAATGVAGVAGADTSIRSAANQQAINLVIARGLAQRGVPYTYGGGDTTGPTRGVPEAPPLVPGTNPLASAPAAGALGVPQSGAMGNTSGVDTLGAATTLPGADGSAMTGTNANVVGFDASGLIVYALCRRRDQDATLLRPAVHRRPEDPACTGLARRPDLLRS